MPIPQLPCQGRFPPVCTPSLSWLSFVGYVHLLPFLHYRVYFVADGLLRVLFRSLKLLIHILVQVNGRNNLLLPCQQFPVELFQDTCPNVNDFSLLQNPTSLLQPLLLFRSQDNQKIVFALRQTSPWSSPLPWQQLPRTRSRHIRLTAMVTVRNVKCDRRNVTSPSLSQSFTP